MKNKRIIVLLILCCSLLVKVAAQNGITRISGNVYCAEDGAIIGANVVEIDANNRIVEATVTDFNGNFSLTVKHVNDRLKISYIGYETQVLPIGGKRSFKVLMKNTTTIKELVVNARKVTRTSGLVIPDREVSVAQQTFKMSDVEGLSFTSADEALQGKISGLDIVFNSGNLGAGTSMRLRGVSTINGNAEPLIVVDGQIFENPDQSFDFTNANEESFAQLLTVNPEDIESITVKKDAGATAMWGSRGANGVIEITTRHGARGKTKVEYSYRYTGNWQPKGYDMLSGDDYTMMLKEEYYNPSQSNTSRNIRELNYDPTWSEYENWNKNTDWVKEVTQYGQTSNHYLTISGGGEKANYRISGGYDRETGTIIQQKLDRYSTRLVLDYFVSDRIKFSTNVALTYTDNHKNYDDNILQRAYEISPNMAVRDYSTGDYYKMLPSGSSYGNNNYSSSNLSDIKSLGNPVAIANLAWRRDKTYRITPQMQIDYKLLGIDEDKAQLDYTGMVFMDIFSENTPSYYPSSLSTDGWTSSYANRSYNYDSNQLSFTTRHTLTFTPHFNNKDFYLTMLVRGEFTSGNSNYQSVTSYNLPTGSITNPTVDAYNSDMSSGTSQWRSVAFLYSLHTSYKSKYAVDFTLRRDGSTKFGASRRWGNFPGVSLRWNISDEPFMKWSSSWLSLLSFRPSWGITGNQPTSEYLHYSKYSSYGSYGKGDASITSIHPDGLKLSDLRWEKTNQYNIGGNIGLFNDMITADFNYYYKTTSDLLMRDRSIPSTSGFTSVSWMNVGSMINKGWELNASANNVIKIKDFSMTLNLNVSQNFNSIKEMDATVLESINSEWSASNLGTYLNRIQVGNPLGSIYGFRYKGVYRYDYDHYSTALSEKAAGRNGTAPIVYDVNGNLVYGSDGKPLRMVYNYDGLNYEFRGGDAIYEDVNHDGQINSLDIVYLGNSNPKLSGGFGINFNYKRWALKTNFNFRLGFKIINAARMQLEKMCNNYNQITTVNLRWRKNGDITEIPRSLYGTSFYNWLGSDRYVEDGSFCRFQYLQLSYGLSPQMLKPLGLSSVRLACSANNLFCWTGYTGTDPEHSTGSWGVCSDDSQTPRARSFTLSIIVGF